MVTQQKTGEVVTKRTGLVLLTLASAQFLTTLDSSVMNVSIASVAKDVGTTVTGIQTAITHYTLVMATLMLTGGKIGAIIGRQRAFASGCDRFNRHRPALDHRTWHRRPRITAWSSDRVIGSRQR